MKQPTKYKRVVIMAEGIISSTLLKESNLERAKKCLEVFHKNIPYAYSACIYNELGDREFKKKI